MEKPYLILTGGDGGYGNLGDEWLLEATKSHYREVLQNYNVIILMANIPDNLNEESGFIYIKDNLDSFLAQNISIKNIAAVHYYGGGYINSYWMTEKLWLYDYLVKSGFPKRKFYFTGIGLGPLKDNEINIVKKIASESSYFGVRDNSFNNKTGGDFMFDESVALAPRVKRPINRKNEIWVNFRIAGHVGVDEAKLSVLIGQIERMAKSYKLKVKYFSMIHGEGFDEKAEMTRLLNTNNIFTEVIDRPINYSGLLKQFKNAALVATTSYHATLAALYTAKPVISVFENDYYDYKYNGLKEVLDTPLLNILNLTSYSVQELQKALNSKDKKIGVKIENLRVINKKTYQKYNKFLNII